MLEIVEEYKSRNVVVCFVKLRSTCKELFKRSGLVEIVGSENFHGKILEAVNSIRDMSPTSSDPGPGEPADATRFTNVTNSRGLPFRRNDGEEEFISFGSYSGGD